MRRSVTRSTQIGSFWTSIFARYRGHILSRRLRLVTHKQLDLRSGTNGDDRTGGGVYLWNSREAAERFYSDAWKSTIAQRYGAQPEILFYDTSIIVANVDQKASAA